MSYFCDSEKRETFSARNVISQGTGTELLKTHKMRDRWDSYLSTHELLTVNLHSGLMLVVKAVKDNSKKQIVAYVEVMYHKYFNSYLYVSGSCL
jgi:hypothetical protein